MLQSAGSVHFAKSSAILASALKRTPWFRPLSILLLLYSASCATPAPRASDYYKPAQSDDAGLIIDLDLLATAKLPEEKKLAGEELLRFFHSAETSLQWYIEDAEGNIELNEKLRVKYGVTDAIVGGVAGFSSPAIIFATAAVAVPIAGAIWIGVSQCVQQFVIDPEVEVAKNRLAEARRLVQLFPDTITAFRGLVFAESETEALRRFNQWQGYVESHKKKIDRFFIGE